MLKKAVSLLALLFLIADVSSAQTIYKPERGVFVGLGAGVIHQTNIERTLSAPLPVFDDGTNAFDKTILIVGPVVKVPVSIKVFGNKWLTFEPQYQHCYLISDKDWLTYFGMTFRFNF